MSTSSSPITVPALARKKSRGEKITMLTAYDYPTALLVDRAGVDVVLVGDSLVMEELGYDSTVPGTMEMMLHHIKAVRRGVAHALVAGDLPFLSYQVNADEAVRNAGRLLQEGGANAVKLEGGVAIAPTIRRVVDAGIPVIGHIGFTPQSVNQIGLQKQGKDAQGAEQVMQDARAVQEAGAFAIVLELIPDDLAARVTEELEIITIGIGAGPRCDGQVLVTSDLLGMRPERAAFKHVRQYAQIGAEIERALSAYREDVEAGRFP
ncbi:3-methyl-2-oxobutanoate hydroxymethyltransferase [Capsulimonas corticalis]|uniref:3-methyl-2-oxobutanoate hydroxymethyltransferase n=1 Tax=Capsulimonas corticalis TaxID=2219043 RepID=A0A402D4N9_9BACT|nr:3-methyl-2-oxobutanoate hydroxymethyltransferase [Capsulimonas corticalis]BDI29233.1 3-methyl-2-oxobutanoate hydroxymethyltransferase [Capsulimonas corticalis]